MLARRLNYERLAFALAGSNTYRFFPSNRLRAYAADTRLPVVLLLRTSEHSSVRPLNRREARARRASLKTTGAPRASQAPTWVHGCRVRRGARHACATADAARGERPPNLDPRVVPAYTP